MITIQNLRYAYQPKQVVLHDISLQFSDNQIHGLVGNNGEGKTTFFKCLLGLLKVYEGTIVESNGQSIRKNTGYLPTELFFYPRITGEEYIHFMLKAKGITYNRQEIDNWNDVFQLPLNEYVENYSTGMKKKLALLALIMQKNQFLLLDEPFNGVDLVSNVLLKDILLRLKASTTIILTSHILESLTTLCDDIAHLHKGRITKVYLPHEFANIEQAILTNYSTTMPSLAK
jgi:ABC-2 type transport system ATP-binding protein